MTDAKAQMVQTYGAAWLEPDELRRAALLQQCWAEDGLYQDPTGEAAGRAALNAHIGGFHTSQPGARIEITSGVACHHSNIYFKWLMRAGDGSVVVEGVDFGSIGADGRITRITGFFGPPPDQ
jgi:SnoaL-like domain